MKISLVPSKGSSISEIALDSLMVCILVHLKSMSGPGSFFTKVAGEGHSIQMVGFNVCLYVIELPFFSTNFAHIESVSPI